MSLVTRGYYVALALAALCPASGFAAGVEAAASGAHEAFWRVSAPRFERGARVAAVSGRAVSFAGMDIPIPIPIVPQMLAMAGQVPAGVKIPAKEIGLSALLNRHLKTTLVYTLGGKNVWVSGGFDRSDKAHVSVLEEGKPARFFNVEELLTKPGMLDIGSAKYKLSVSPDLADLLESEIVLTNAANRRDQQRITLREMLTAVSVEGADAAVGGVAYRMFYYDDIKDGLANPATKSFVFMHIDSEGNNTVFQIAAESVPGDKIATFTMLGGKTVGLQQVGGKLRIFDNP